MTHSKKCTLALCAGLAVGLNIALASGPPTDKLLKLPDCPVMGEPIDMSISARTDEGPVFFCCTACVERYQKNPQKYAEKVAAQRAALKDLPKVQVACPVSGEAADHRVSIEQDGQKVFFCCEGCVSKFKADPGKYEAALANSYTHQTHCPVMGEPINPKSSALLPTGQKIFYCCDPCIDKFKKSPAKYAPKLAAQGVYVSVAKLLEGGKKAAPRRGGY